VIEQAVEIDRLLRHHRIARDAVFGLVAGGYNVDDKVARRAYLSLLRAMRDSDLLVPRSGTSKRALARLRGRKLRAWRLLLDYTIADRGGINAISAYGRRVAEYEPDEWVRGERVYRREVLTDQFEATRRILQGSISQWHRQDDFVNAVPTPPPRPLLDELHRRLGLWELRRVIAATDVAGLRETAVALGAAFLGVAEAQLAIAEAHGFSFFGDLELTRARHTRYRKLLFDDPVLTARFVPFFLSIADSDKLDTVLGWLLFEVALCFPDPRAMTLALTTWPHLARADWRRTA
jgi:hypothetical protein